MQDDRTTNFNLPKPGAGNLLTDDLARLRSALDLIDTAIAARATSADISAQLAALIGSAPATLDTLKELADAIGNDPSFATHVAANIASLQASLASLAASGVSYNGASSGISATTVQGAIDYLKNIAGAGSGGSVASYTRQKFTATAGQTTFTTSGYTVGYLQVFLNGVLLDITDYTAANGSTVVLATGAAAGDELVTIALDSFNIANLLRVLTASASAPAGSVSIGADGGLTVKSLNGGPLAGMRNRIINGAMMIDQRNAGASLNPAGSGVYTVDRWKAQCSTGTFQRITSTLSGYPYSLKYTGAGSNAYMQMGQQIEFLNCCDLQNQTVTISFKAKANNSNSGSTALTVRTRTLAGTDGGCIFAAANVDTSVTLTTSEASYVVTRTLPASFGSLSLEFAIGSHVSGDGFEITGVQLEKGSVATPFEFRPFGAELALCQRYFYTSYCYGTAIGAVTSAGSLIQRAAYTGNATHISRDYPVPMRTVPSVTTYNMAGSQTVSVAGESGDKSCSVYFTGSYVGIAAINHIACSAEL